MAPSPPSSPDAALILIDIRTKQQVLLHPPPPFPPTPPSLYIQLRRFVGHRQDKMIIRCPSSQPRSALSHPGMPQEHCLRRAGHQRL